MARRSWRRWLGHPTNGVLACVAAKLALHLSLAHRYGPHRDELYYLAGANRLDWGFVDYPPLTALLLRLVRLTLGDSLLAIRLLPALAGCAVVLLGAAMVRRFEGGKWAQLMTALSLTVAPVYLQFSGMWAPNAFDCLWWTIGAYLLIGLCDLRQGRTWIWLGVIGGLGLQTKHSMLFWGFGIAVAALCTRQRRWLWSRQLWVGALIAAVTFLPNLLWQWHHGWPTRELLEAGRDGKNFVPEPWEFVGQQLLILHPFTAPLWLAGAIRLCLSTLTKPYRAVGVAFVAVWVTLFLLHGKHYYLAAAYPPVLAAGAVWWERWLSKRDWNRLRASAPALLLLGGCVTAPLVVPILPPAQLAPYAGVIEGGRSRTENLEQGALPQHQADQFGWPEMAAAVAKAWNTLTPEEQQRAVIFAGNYGRAGAIDFYGPALGLPAATCPHNNYWLWGPQGDGDIMVIIGGRAEQHREQFASVTQAATHDAEWAMPYERRLGIFVCRGLKPPALAGRWAALRRYR